MRTEFGVCYSTQDSKNQLRNSGTWGRSRQDIFISVFHSRWVSISGHNLQHWHSLEERTNSAQLVNFFAHVLFDTGYRSYLAILLFIIIFIMDMMPVAAYYLYISYMICMLLYIIYIYIYIWVYQCVYIFIYWYIYIYIYIWYIDL